MILSLLFFPQKKKKKKEMPKSTFQSLAIESHEALSYAFHIIQ